MDTAAHFALLHAEEWTIGHTYPHTSDSGVARLFEIGVICLCWSSAQQNLEEGTPDLNIHKDLLSDTAHKAILSCKQISIGFDDSAADYRVCSEPERLHSGAGVIVIVIMHATIPL